MLDDTERAHNGKEFVPMSKRKENSTRTICATLSSFIIYFFSGLLLLSKAHIQMQRQK